MEEINTPGQTDDKNTANKRRWTPLKKFSFRFFFVFLGVTTEQCWALLIFTANSAISKDMYFPGMGFKSLTGIFYWLDQHIYHTGYNPKIHDDRPADNHFGIIYHITLAVVSIIVALIWGMLDKRRINNERLSYWFRVYLRYVLAIVIFGYGIDKLIPVQMGRPNALMMMSNYGHLNRFTVLWTFMGLSPGYMMFSGTLEVIASLLLFFRRTAVAGYVLTFGILANVVALNWFYNIPVKLFSALLMLYTLFLLVPYLKGIFQYFFLYNATPIKRGHYVFETRWKGYLIAGILLGVSLIFTLLPACGTYQRYKEYQADSRKEKIYEVTTFVAKDTVPALMTDTLRWRRVFMYLYGDQFVISDMKDKQHWYDFEVDSVKKTFTLHNNPDKSTWKIFHYTYPSKDQLQMTGKWKGKDISVTMKLLPVDSIPLNKERVKFIQEGAG